MKPAYNSCVRCFNVDVATLQLPCDRFRIYDGQTVALVVFQKSLTLLPFAPGHLSMDSVGSRHAPAFDLVYMRVIAP